MKDKIIDTCHTTQPHKFELFVLNFEYKHGRKPKAITTQKKMVLNAYAITNTILSPSM